MLPNANVAASARLSHTRLRTASKLVAAILLLGATAITPALAQHHGHGVHDRGGKSGPATRGFKAAHDQMMRSMMAVPYTGDTDVDFRAQMIPHHQAAIDMAEVALRHSKNPWTRQMAESVIVEQKREIAEMQVWLAQHGARVPPGGQTSHVIGSKTYLRPPEEPGTRAELVGKSWAPGTGVPAQ